MTPVDSSSRIAPVVVTRPIAQARPLADRLRELGREPVLFPLLEIEPVSDPRPLQALLARLDDYALAAFVSPNAIDAVLPHVPTWPRSVAIAVMGEGSKAALAAHGITPANATVHSPADSRRTDSQTLLESIDVAVYRARRAVIFRGDGGRELLADALRAAGAEVEQLAVYRRKRPALDAQARSTLQGLIDASADWIITSSEALRHLLEMAEELGGTELVSKLQQQTLFVPHARIADTARAAGFSRVTLTDAGDEGLLAALQS